MDEWDQNRVGTKFLSPRKQSVDDKTSLPAKMLAKELIGKLVHVDACLFRVK